MRAHKLLIVTERFDLTSDAVILKLREMGQLPVRINFEDIPLETNFSLKLEGRVSIGQIHTKNRDARLEDIRSVLWRWSNHAPIPAHLPLEQIAFGSDESCQALNGLWANLHCYWMNFPGNSQAARWKGAQLKRAAELGFEIPRSLITSQPDAVRIFYEQCSGQIVFKAMGNSGLKLVSDPAEEKSPSSVQGICTTLIKEADLADHLFEIANSPCLFQQFIEKHKEFRVTIIGDEIFVVEIQSDQQVRLPLNWYANDTSISLKPGTLPPDIAGRCVNFARDYGLNFAMIDLILTSDGRYVFLELDPSGQCLLLQQWVPELKMIDAVASCLLRGNPLS